MGISTLAIEGGHGYRLSLNEHTASSCFASVFLAYRFARDLWDTGEITLIKIEAVASDINKFVRWVFVLCKSIKDL